MNPNEGNQILSDNDFGFWKDKGIGGRSMRLSSVTRCPKCKIDLEFKGKQKKTSKFTYYRYELSCPKCGEITLFSEGKKYRCIGKRRLSRMLGRHAGDIGERFARKILFDAGYEVRSFADLSFGLLCKDESGDVIMERGIAKMFLGDKYPDFIRFCEAWNNDPEVPSTIRGVRLHGTETFSPTGVGLDFVGKKDDKIYIIEVKTNRAILQDYQKKMLLKAKEFDFVPLVLRVKVKIDIPQEKVKWNFL